MVPFDDKSPFVTSGIRVGTPAMTTRGLGVDEFKLIARLIDEVIQNPDDQSTLNNVEKQVLELCEAFPLYDFVTA